MSRGGVQEGVKKGMRFHHHQLEKVKKHQRSHNSHLARVPREQGRLCAVLAYISVCVFWCAEADGFREDVVKVADCFRKLFTRISSSLELPGGGLLIRKRNTIHSTMKVNASKILRQ